MQFLNKTCLNAKLSGSEKLSTILQEYEGTKCLLSKKISGYFKARIAIQNEYIGTKVKAKQYIIGQKL